METIRVEIDEETRLRLYCWHMSLVWLNVSFFVFFYRKGYVPDVLMATIEPPARLPITGRGCLIQARLCRPKRDDSRGDHQAKEVSDGLPFLEYELHRQLINKLHVKGMNAIFGLRVRSRRRLGWILFLFIFIFD